jgi:subtilisin family serine protease
VHSFHNNKTLYNRPITLNYRARSIQQTFATGNDATVSPYTAAGLLGDNQIGAVADTGVDSTSCYFYDSKCRVKAASMYKPTTDFNCRKIIQYSFVPKYGDTLDIVEGHGTHVAGTMLGKISTAEPLTEGNISQTY